MSALASHQCGPGSNPGPGAISGLSLLLVLILAPRVLLWVILFSSLHKINISKFQPIRSGIQGSQVSQSWDYNVLPSLNKVNLFIYLFMIIRNKDFNILTKKSKDYYALLITRRAQLSKNALVLKMSST